MSTRSADSLFSEYPALDYFMSTNNYWAYYQGRLPGLIIKNLGRRPTGSNKVLRILDVGCGTGDFSIPIFEELSHYYTVEITAFDPSAHAVEAYRAAYRNSTHQSLLMNASIGTIQTFPSLIHLISYSPLIAYMSLLRRPLVGLCSPVRCVLS